jgi:N-acetylneuraminic acid mutarotase
MSLVGAGGVVGGVEIGRRWPIQAIDSLMEQLGRAHSLQTLLGIDYGQNSATWTKFARSDLPRYESTKAIIEGTLYLFGGFYTGHPKATARVESLNLTTGEWRRFKDMPVALTHAPAVVLHGKVWLAGGFEGNHPGPTSARVWIWDIATDTWTNGPPLPEPRGGGGFVVFGDTLHYFGGWPVDRNTDSASHWSLAAGGTVWQRRAPMPNPRGHLSSLTQDGFIYAISGNVGHDPLPLDVAVVQRYDPATDRWEELPPAPFALSHNESSTFSYDGRILSFGGRSLHRFVWNQNDMVSFNPATRAWSHLGRVPVSLMGAVAFARGDSAFVGLGASHGNNPTNPFFWHTPLRNVWRAADPLPDGVGETAAGVIGHSLYIVGEGSPWTLRYDLAAGTTERLPSVRPARGHHHAAEVIDDKLWLLGGLGGAEGFTQIFDPSTLRWTVGPRMPFGAGSSASAVIGGRIYVAGGIVDRKTTNQAAMLEPRTGIWTPIAPMPKPRNHAASGTDGRRLFVFGGRGPGSGDDNIVADGFNDVQIYEPTSNTWLVSDGTAGAPTPMPQGRGGMGKAVWLNGEFWVFGGETLHGSGATRDKVYARVDIYNPTTNTWRAGPAMRTARHGIFPVLHEGQIIIAGGGVTAGDSQTRVVEAIWPKP